MKSYFVWTHFLFEFMYKMSSLTLCVSSVTHSTYTDYFLQLKHPNCWSEITIFTTMCIMHLWQSTMFQSLECLVCFWISALFFIIPSHVFSQICICFHVPREILVRLERLCWELGTLFTLANWSLKLSMARRQTLFCCMLTQGMSSLPFVWLLTYFWSKPRSQMK